MGTQAERENESGLYALGEGDAPFLGAPSVVDGLVRGFMADVTGWRGEQLAGRMTADEVVAQAQARAEAFQRIFYGRDPAYKAGAQNDIAFLARHILAYCGYTDTPAGDMVKRLFGSLFGELAAVLVRHEDDEIGDDEMRDEIESMVHFYTTILMGLEPEEDNGDFIAEIDRMSKAGEIPEG